MSAFGSFLTKISKPFFAPITISTLFEELKRLIKSK
jgi:hypothetical protein